MKAYPILFTSLVMGIAACSADTDVSDPAPRKTASGDQEVRTSPAETPAIPPAQEKGPTLVLEIDGVRTAEGKLCYSLFDEEHEGSFGRDGIAESDVTRADCVVANAGKVTVNLSDLPAGKYAVALFHDQNGNGKLDKMGALGIPTEGFGFSRNPPIRMGAPDFTSCAFTLPASGVTETIKLNYLL